MAQPGFPTAPSFTTEALQPPPALRPDMPVEDQIKEIHNFLNSQWVSLNSMQTSIESGWLIDTVRILNLEASTITSGSIFTQDLYIGEDQLITLSGSTNRIEIEDENGQIRTRIGNLGAGATNWGQEWWDSSGTLIMSVGDTVFINGAVISNATISDSKIIGMDGGKLTNGTVTDSKIANLSANKITAGTLIVNGSPAIQVTSAGACVFTAGGDIIMRAATNDHNYISWRTSGDAERANAAYQSLTNTFTIQSVGGADMRILASGSIQIGIGGTSTPIDIGGRFNSNLLPMTHGTLSLGLSGLKWANIHAVNTNFGDIGMENGYRMTEANKVWSWKKPEDGWVLMNDMWQPLLYIDRQGNATFSGRVTYGKLPEPDVERMEDQGESQV